MKKELGKIEEVFFGYTGYQEGCIGLSLTFRAADGSCVDSSIAKGWAPSRIKWSPRCKWSEESRQKDLGHTMRLIDKIMADAKVSDVMQLKGKPVELTFDGIMLKDWRILTEVL